MTTPTELAATKYWNAYHMMRDKRLTVGGWAEIRMELEELASDGPPRVSAIVARRLLRPCAVASEQPGDVWPIGGDVA